MWTRTFLLMFAVGCAGLDTADDTTEVVAEESTAELSAATNTDRCVPSFTAAGRAFGLKLDALGLVHLPPTPDTNITNPANLVKLVLALPLGIALSLVDTVFSVSDDRDSDYYSASDVAVATTNALSVSVPFVNVSATTLRAQAQSEVSEYGASASTTGSLVQNLRINGRNYLDINGPLTVVVRLPLLGTPLAEVRVLETVKGGDGYDSASASVNALHVVLLDGSVDVVVAHAESEAKARRCKYD